MGHSFGFSGGFRNCKLCGDTPADVRLGFRKILCQTIKSQWREVQCVWVYVEQAIIKRQKQQSTNDKVQDFENDRGK